MLRFGSKEVKFITSEVPSYDRRLVLVGSAKKLKELSEAWDWKEDVKKNLIPFYSYFKLAKGLKEDIESKEIRILTYLVISGYYNLMSNYFPKPSYSFKIPTISTGNFSLAPETRCDIINL